MSRPEGFEFAVFRPLDQAQAKGVKEVKALFNPASLEHSVKNTLKEQGNGSKKKQYVTQSTAQLSMELIFDTTDTGEDVRTHTSKLEVLMNPLDPGSGKKKQVATVMQFEWGAYAFTGMIESLKQKLDFFAPNGVPLRSTVNLTMARQDETFEANQAAVDAEPSFDAIETPTTPDQGPAAAAGAAGDPRGARALAAANGEESLRFSAGAGLVVGGGISLGGAAAFASGGVGAGISAGAGFGISGGAGIGVSGGAGIGISAGAGVGIGASAGVGGGARFDVSGGAGLSIGASAGASASASFGGSASAGVTASAGAFAGLRTSVEPPRVSFDTELLTAKAETVSISTDEHATFQVGGQANVTGSSSLSADVGAKANLNASITFDEA